MACYCLSHIDNIMFSYEFQYLEFMADGRSVSIILADSRGNSFFDGEYIPDIDGKVALFDINEIVDVFIGNAPTADIKLVCRDNTDSVERTYNIKMLRSSVAFNVVASVFLQNRFLTSSDETRFTCVGRYECLNFFASNPERVTADVSYWKDDGTLRTVRMTLRYGDYPPDTIVTVDVSPKKVFDISPDKIIEYTVVCGNRRQRYVVLPEEAADPAIAFRNRFNVWDTFYFTGTKETDPQFDRSQAWINGQYLTYDVKEVMQFKAMTGVLPEDAFEYLYDIARSPEVRLLDSSGVMRELLTVMDCELKAVNDDNALNRFTVNYRFADKISAKSLSAATTRLFDNSFDGSYE